MSTVKNTKVGGFGALKGMHPFTVEDELKAMPKSKNTKRRPSPQKHQRSHTHNKHIKGKTMLKQAS